MNFRKWLCNNASSILTGIGGIGVVATVVLSVKATPDAFIKLEAAKTMKRRASEDEHKPVSLTPLEAVKICWKDYSGTEKYVRRLHHYKAGLRTYTGYTGPSDSLGKALGGIGVQTKQGRVPSAQSGVLRETDESHVLFKIYISGEQGGSVT